MFREGPLPNKKVKMNLMLHSAGLGDNVGAMVAINHVCKYFTWVEPIVWVPDYMLEFATHVLPKYTIIRPFSKGSKEYNDRIISRVNEWKMHTAKHTNPVDHAFHIMCDISPDIQYKNYLHIRPEEIDVSKFNLPEKYIVIPSGATTKAKELPVDVTNEICRYITGKGYTPVFLGKKENIIGVNVPKLTSEIMGIDFSLGIDLTEKTTLMESAAILAKAHALIGMEGGLTHLAACTDTNIIASYTFVDPKVTAPYRNSSKDYKFQAIVPQDLGCRFCQTNIPLIHPTEDYRDCFYGDYLCRNFQFEDFKSKIDLIL